MRYGFKEMANYALFIGTNDSSNFHEAINSPKSEEYMGIMKNDTKSLSTNQTWDLVSLPMGKKIVGCKWVLKRKSGFSEK